MAEVLRGDCFNLSTRVVRRAAWAADRQTQTDICYNINMYIATASEPSLNLRRYLKRNVWWRRALRFSKRRGTAALGNHKPPNTVRLSWSYCNSLLLNFSRAPKAERTSSWVVHFCYQCWWYCSVFAQNWKIATLDSEFTNQFREPRKARRTNNEFC